MQSPRELDEYRRKFSPRGLPARARRTAPGQHDEIVTAQSPPVLAKHFPHQPLDPVAVHGTRSNLLADDDADTRALQPVRLHEHAEMAADRHGLASERRLIPGPFQETRRSRQRRPVRGVQTLSRARPFARRARITARPPRVRIRTRKPWVRLRRVFDG